MHFVSTRHNAPALPISAAISAGLASDGGLYVPSTLPNFSAMAFDGADTLAAIAQRLLLSFFGEDELSAELAAVCDEAFNFPAPLTALGSRTQVLELFHGPTAAFKDFGARFLACCMRRINRDQSRLLTILVATSGDTGSAVAAAFHRIPGVRVIILYPKNGVSPRQAHLLGCFGDNIHALRIDGTFDHCQRLVKRALNDEELRADQRLSSANSISLGRWLPQMAYYAFSSLAHHRAYGTKLSFIIPTGNLGNAMACLLARELKLPIGRVALATNANRVLPDFFATGNYEPRPSLPTLANAMDVGDPSNFERLRWLYPDPQELRTALSAQSVDDEAIRSTIRSGEKAYGHIWCPHTATAVCVREKLRNDNETEEWAIVATAHPAKFEQVVEPLIGHGVDVPQAMDALLQKPAASSSMSADYGLFRQWLQDGGASAAA